MLPEFIPTWKSLGVPQLASGVWVLKVTVLLETAGVAAVVTPFVLL